MIDRRRLLGLGTAATEENGLIVGRVGGEGGEIAFAVAIYTNLGTFGHVAIAQYLPIEHDTNDKNDISAVTNGKINVVLTVTDYDGDTVTRSIDISEQIQFKDDGPVVVGKSTATVDEADLANSHVGAGHYSLTVPFLGTLFDFDLVEGSAGTDGTGADTTHNSGFVGSLLNTLFQVLGVPTHVRRGLGFVDRLPVRLLVHGRHLRCLQSNPGARTQSPSPQPVSWHPVKPRLA
jgi:VCBS repeat-containing protein